MYVAKVVGRVWANKKVEQLPPGSLLEVELEHSKERIVALDLLSCGEGEKVLIVTGSVASRTFNKAGIDAAVIACIERQ